MMRRTFLVIGALLLAIIVPIAVLSAIALLEPSPWRLIGTPSAEWRDGRTLPGGGRATVQPFGDAEEARAAAAAKFDGIRARSSTTSPGQYRYTTAQGTSAMIAPIDRFVLMAEGPDAETLDRDVDALPFLAPRATLGRALQHYIRAFVGVIIGYALLCTILFCRGLAWAGRRAAAPNAQPKGEADLRDRLATLADASASGTEIRITSPHRDATLRLRLYADERTVRAVLGGAAVRSGLNGWRIAWWRTIPRPGDWTERAAQIVTEAGWEWRPVLTFVRPIGG